MEVTEKNIDEVTDDISKEIKKIAEKYKINIFWGAGVKNKDVRDNRTKLRLMGSIAIGRTENSGYDMLDLLEAGARFYQFLREYVRDIIFRRSFYF